MNPSWNQGAVNGFFQNLSAGSFHPAGPLELLGFLALVGMVALFYFGYTRRTQLQLHSERRRRATESYRASVENLKPSPTEAKLLESLVARMARPEIEKHQLFKSRDVFDRTEKALLETEPRQARELMALRVRLGYGARVDGRTLKNSADIPPATMLADDEGRNCFRVLSVHPGFILAESLEAREEGKPLELIISRPDGKYLFRTTILSRKEGRVALQHDEMLKRIQVRNYFRTDVSVPVRLGGHTGETLNLSGGGLCMRRPPGEFQVDDILNLVLELEPLEPGIPVEARVTHVDDPGRLHLEFRRIREGDRDRIIRDLMNGQRRDTHAMKDA